MPGPHSTRPGDIVTALNGKKVDIINTDAEGRLILGDALTYAERLGRDPPRRRRDADRRRRRAPSGNQVTGAFGTPQPFYDEVAAAGERAGERYWQLPLIDDYVTEMESWYGDLAELRLAGGLARQERALPARVRDPAVGPPRHRRRPATTARRRRTRRAARPASRTRRSSSWPSPAPGPADRPRRPAAPRRRPGRRPADGAAVRRARGRRASPSASRPTASRRAGRSTTRSTRRAGPSTGGRRSPRSSGRWRSACCRSGSRATRWRSRSSAPGSSRWSSGWRPTSTSGCCPTC